MALQTSGTITAADIRDEFGGSNPVNLDDYYRGGSLVPDTPTNSGVPTSGTISYADFYGAAAAPAASVVFPSLLQVNANSIILNTSIVEATLTFQSNGGFLTSFISAGSTIPFTTQWIDPITSGIGSNYEMRITEAAPSPFIVVSPAPSTTWINISSNRSWSFTSATLGFELGNYNIEIRPIANPSAVNTTGLTVILTGN